MTQCLTPEQSSHLCKTIAETLGPDVGFVILTFPSEPYPGEAGRAVGLGSSKPMGEVLQIILKFAEKVKAMVAA